MPPKQIILRSEVTLDSEQLRSIGCVAVESTYLDESLDWVIRHLCVLDEHDFRVLTNGALLSAKLDILREVTRSRIKPEFENEHQTLFGNIAHQIGDRNNIIHGVWHVPTLRGTKTPNEGRFGWIAEGEAFATRTYRTKAGHTTFKTKDIMATARALAECVDDLHLFLRKSGLYPPPKTRSAPRNPLVIQIRDSTANNSERPKSRPKVQE